MRGWVFFGCLFRVNLHKKNLPFSTTPLPFICHYLVLVSCISCLRVPSGCNGVLLLFGVATCAVLLPPSRPHCTVSSSSLGMWSRSFVNLYLASLSPPCESPPESPPLPLAFGTAGGLSIPLCGKVCERDSVILCACMRLWETDMHLRASRLLQTLHSVFPVILRSREFNFEMSSFFKKHF